MKTNLKLFSLFFLLLIIASCNNQDSGKINQKPENDPLPSWNEGETKSTIVEFIDAVTKTGDPMFVEKEDRIATFDNDGTLWCEKPMYIHFMGIFGRFKELIKENPELAKQEPYKSIATKDFDFFMGLLEKKEFLEIVGDLMGVPFEGFTTDEYAKWNNDFFANWKHPKYKEGYQGLIYQPMLELVKYLQDNDFKVYISTADEGAFLQLYSEELYNIPSEMVLGTSVKLSYKSTDGKAAISRSAQGRYLNNWDGKPRQIWKVIGKKPILSAGNSDGDFHMLQWVAESEGPGLSLMVHHTDSIREYYYEKHTGKVLPMIKEVDGTLINIKNDWKTVFPSK